MTLKPIPNGGEHMSLALFYRRCELAEIIDDDGYGFYATEAMISDVPVKPSHIVVDPNGFEHELFTYVVWYDTPFGGR